MKRLFVFGCSYTSYAWPTWANLLEFEYDHVENWAMAGLGNRAIAERVAECNARSRFTKDDIVIVQWSSHLRNDWWHQESMPERTVGWKTYGSIFNYHNEKLYDKKWLSTFFYEPAYFMHTLNNISLVQGMLKSAGCQWFMTSMGDIREMGSDMRDKDGYGEKTNIVAGAKNTGKKAAWAILPDLEIYDAAIWQENLDHWLQPMELFCQTCPELTYDFVDFDGSKFIDLHPSPAQHLAWLKQELKDKLGISDESIALSEELITGVNTVHKKMKFNKSAMEHALGRKQGFPKSADKLAWPGKPLGF